VSLLDVKSFNVIIVFVILFRFGLNFIKTKSTSFPNQIETKFYFYINVTMIFLTRLSFYFTFNFI